jgi:hypothetical protein
MHPHAIPPPHYVTLAVFAVGPSSHGCFAFVHHLAIAFVAYTATCGVLLCDSRAGSVLVVLIENVSISPTLICFRDKLSLPPLHILPNPELHISTHMRETMTGIYASHRSKHIPTVSLLCRFQPTFPVSITCNFPAILVLLVSSLQRVFPFTISPYLHSGYEDVCILANNDVYTSRAERLLPRLYLFT